MLLQINVNDDGSSEIRRVHEVHPWDVPQTFFSEDELRLEMIYYGIDDERAAAAIIEMNEESEGVWIVV